MPFVEQPIFYVAVLEAGLKTGSKISVFSGLLGFGFLWVVWTSSKRSPKYNWFWLGWFNICQFI